MAIHAVPGISANDIDPPDADRDEDGRVVIPSPQRLTAHVDATMAAVAEREVFQRGGGLVDIIRDPELGEGDVIVPEGEPRVRVTPFLRLYELVTQAAKFVARRKNQEKSVSAGRAIFETVEIDPPARVVKLLMERGEWSHIRPLDAMVSWPVLRPDGTVFDGIGYDARTRCYSTAFVGLDVPPCVTPEHVAQAIKTIDDVIGEFPFERPEHKSAWYAALLATLARPAVKGPLPMLIVDANDRGSGKTLLCDTLGTIVTGAALPRRGVPGNEEEWGKVMLGIGIGSYSTVLLDNVTGTLRSSTLDMVLTGEVYQGRVLGLNKEMRVPVRSQFIVSSNNAKISTDLVRRSLHCRIVVPVERPESRTNFRYSLPRDTAVPEMRRKLLTAAFTILIGYEQAGRPKVEARALGSYEAWSERIQAPIVWAGMADPVLTQDELRDQADAEGEQLGPLIDAWFDMYGEQTNTVASVLRDIADQSNETHYASPNPKAIALRSAIDAIGEPGKRTNATYVGNRIARWKDKVMNGKTFFAGKNESGSRKWGVKPVG